jgi:hypothetical protein
MSWLARDGCAGEGAKIAGTCAANTAVTGLNIVRWVSMARRPVPRISSVTRHMLGAVSAEREGTKMINLRRVAALGVTIGVALIGCILTAGPASAASPCTKNSVGWNCTVRTTDGATLGSGGGYPNGHGLYPGQVMASVAKDGGPGKGMIPTGRWVWLDHTPNPASGHFVGLVGRHKDNTPRVPMTSDFWRACTGGAPTGDRAPFTCTAWFK